MTSEAIGGNGRPAKKKPRTWVFLFTATTCVLFVAFAAFASISFLALRRAVYSQTEANLRQYGVALIHLLNADPIYRDDATLRRLCTDLGAGPDFRVTYIDSDGSVIADSLAKAGRLDNHATRPEVAGALAGKETSVVRFSDSLDKTLMYYALPHRGKVIRLAIPVDYLDVANRRILFTLILAAIAIMILTMATSLAVSARLVIPLRQIGKTANDYATGDLSSQFPQGNYPKEFGELATSLNLMATKLREKIAALDDQNRKTDAILASMNDALIVLDGDDRILRANRAAANLLKADERSVEGLPLIQATRNTALADLSPSAADSDGDHVIEFRAQAPDRPSNAERPTDEVRYLLAKKTLIDQGPERVLVLTDLTRQKRLERIRKDFVANVSHELKTPVTSIQGFVETLKDGAIDDPAAARRFLDILDQQSNRLKAIIDDLLTLSWLEQGDACPIKREDTRIADLLDNVRNLCALQAASRETQLLFDVDAALTYPVNPGLIEQAIANLVFNAVKYSPPQAKVSIRAWVEDGRLVCTVEDNGIGIPQKDLKHIFERFYRVDKGRSREMGGTGLGLSIVRHIALVHGGTVSVNSVEGSGSVFRLEIPRAT